MDTIPAPVSPPKTHIHEELASCVIGICTNSIQIFCHRLKREGDIQKLYPFGFSAAIHHPPALDTAARGRVYNYAITSP